MKYLLNETELIYMSIFINVFLFFLLYMYVYILPVSVAITTLVWKCNNLSLLWVLLLDS